MDNKEIGKKIKEERENHKIYQKDFANYLQISKNYLGCIERGERNVTLDLLIKIASYFNVTLDYMISEDLAERKDEVRELHCMIDKCNHKEVNALTDVFKALLPHLKDTQN